MLVEFKEFLSELTITLEADDVSSMKGDVSSHDITHWDMINGKSFIVDGKPDSVTRKVRNAKTP